MVDMTRTHWPEQVKTMQRNWIGKSPRYDHCALLFQCDSKQGLERSDYAGIPAKFIPPVRHADGARLMLLPLPPSIRWQPPRLPTSQVRGIYRECKLAPLPKPIWRRWRKRRADQPLRRQPATATGFKVWIANYVLRGYSDGAVIWRIFYSDC